jgi:hypothetical protein
MRFTEVREDLRGTFSAKKHYCQKSGQVWGESTNRRGVTLAVRNVCVERFGDVRCLTNQLEGQEGGN